MKSTEKDAGELEEIGDTQLDEQTVTPDTQLNSENMDGDAKKTQIYSSNNRLRHGKFKHVSSLFTF